VFLRPRCGFKSETARTVCSQWRSLTSFAQCRLQFCLGLTRKRRFQHSRFIRLDFGEHLVFRYAPKQYKECGRPFRNRRTKFLYKVIGNAVVRQRARQSASTCSGNRTDCHTSKRVHEQKTDQSSPHSSSRPASCSTHCREVDGLLDMNFATLFT